VHIAPTLWELGQRADCRIFQETSAVDIVKKVLEGAGLPPGRQDWHLGEDHPVRVYTVQYRESDLDFIRRLLFEEGIYFAVHATDEEDKVVFGDAPDGLADVAGTTLLTFFEEFGFEGSVDRVRRLDRVASVQSDKVFVRDYDPDKPALALEATAESTDEGEHVLEVYDYPARCTEVAVATHTAEVLLGSLQAERDVVHGDVGSLALWPGLRFSVDGHPYDPLNQAYMVTRSRITGSHPRMLDGGRAARSGREPKHTCEFWAVPTKTTRYRPPRRAREQVIPGLQTAITTGASGSEIHTDAGGHVKVRFHWDRSGIQDDTSSRWIRTSQVPTGGSMLLPRVGWEVTVAHHGGDADRPLVLGRMYNAVTPPPYALPKEAAKSSVQTATTPGGGSSNEFRMGDTKGSEEMFFNASKDMTTEVKNNATETIGNDYKKKVGSNQSRSVTDSSTSSVGANQTIDVGGNQSVKVETFMVDEVGGSHSLSIGGNRDMKVGGDHKRDIGGTSSLEVGGNQIDLVVGSITDETLASFSHQVGAALIELCVGDRVVTVGGASTENAGAAKVIVVKGGRGVNVGGSLNIKVAGAIVNMANADRAEASGGTYTEIAAGAQIVKGNNVVFEADNMLSLVMGASTLTLMPAMIAIAGVSVKIDGDVTDAGTMVVDN
jgi:type VI secretion system secreted protein VgrG